MARPKRVFTDEDMAEIERHATNNAHLDTIALALNIPKQTLIRRFGAFIKQKRAEGRLLLRQAQREKALVGKDAATLIFLGKNELNQTDKQVVEPAGAEQTTLTPDELKELKRLAGLATGIRISKQA